VAAGCVHVELDCYRKGARASRLPIDIWSVGKGLTGLF
jgi:hypothetical protein